MLANRRPVISVLEWGQVELPGVLNSAEVRRRLVNAGETKSGLAFRVQKGRIFANGLVGLISTRDVQVQILPKVATTSDMSGALRLLQDFLSLELDIRPVTSRDAVSETGFSLLEFLIRGFAHKLQVQLENGAPRRYFPLTEELSTIRGRVDLNHQARVAPGGRIRVQVHHAPLHFDNALSRLIRGVVDALILQTRSAASRAILSACVELLQRTVAQTLSSELLDHVALSPFEVEWEWIVSLAEMLLAVSSPSPIHAGEADGLSVLFSMHGLFERAVRRRIQNALGGTTFQIRGNKVLGYLLKQKDGGANLLRLEPDILIDDKSELVLLGDVKWRAAVKGEILREDAFQLVSYLARANLVVGCLVYPASPGQLDICYSERFDGASRTVFALRLDVMKMLNRDPSVVREVNATLLEKLEDLFSHQSNAA